METCSDCGAAFGVIKSGHRVPTQEAPWAHGRCVTCAVRAVTTPLVDTNDPDELAAHVADEGRSERIRVGCLRCGWRGLRRRSLSPFAQCPQCGMACKSMADIAAIQNTGRKASGASGARNVTKAEAKARAYWLACTMLRRDLNAGVLLDQSDDMHVVADIEQAMVEIIEGMERRASSMEIRAAQRARKAARDE